MKVSKEGLSLIKRFESLKLEAYLCPSNVRTIGYGHTHGTFPDKITLDQADAYLVDDAFTHSDFLNKILTNLTQHEFDALACMTFNIGVSGMKNSQIVIGLLNSDRQLALKGFANWVKGGGKVLKGLVRRRAIEREFFVSGKDMYDDVYSGRIDPYKYLGIKE